MRVQGLGRGWEVRVQGLGRGWEVRVQGLGRGVLTMKAIAM